jgi:hypothetical protein
MKIDKKNQFQSHGIDVQPTIFMELFAGSAL